MRRGRLGQPVLPEALLGPGLREAGRAAVRVVGLTATTPGRRGTAPTAATSSKPRGDDQAARDVTAPGRAPAASPGRPRGLPVVYKLWLSGHMHLPADTRPVVVGRDREQAELAAMLADARAGQGRAVLLLGEAGMGKSMLAAWLAGQAEQAGAQVAQGACSAAGMPPLWPWRRALAAIAAQVPWREDGAAAGPLGRELVHGQNNPPRFQSGL